MAASVTQTTADFIARKMARSIGNRFSFLKESMGQTASRWMAGLLNDCISQLGRGHQAGMETAAASLFQMMPGTLGARSLIVIVMSTTSLSTPTIRIFSTPQDSSLPHGDLQIEGSIGPEFQALISNGHTG